ncbi:MAG: hypothetical protein FWG70_11290 [Oscillospiraceae bacterium]|nr:hypothetical protein [Oscillospiraceae bacterium]
MNLQTKASFKKELLAFFRTKAFIIILLVFIGFSIFDPLLIRGLGLLMDAMSETYDEMGMDVSQISEMMGSAASMGVQQFLGDIMGIGLIVGLLLMNRFAGGEQKKRSIIIPRSSGLGNFSYITPKFFIYPLAVLILMVIATLSASVVSALAFAVNDLVIFNVVIAGLLMGVNFMMYVCFHLALGTAMGKPGLSAAICIGASMIVPLIFSILSTGIENEMLAYNPFSLGAMSLVAIYEPAPLTETIITVAMTLGIMVIVYLLALFAQNAKKIDNSGNEILI